MPDWVSDLIAQDPAGVALVVGVLIGVVVVATVVLRMLWRPVRRLMHFIDDVAGEEERPGQDARPGLMERIAAIEDKQTHVERFVAATEAHREETGRTLDKILDDVAASRHQLGPNGGRSVLDRVDALHSKVDAALAWQKKHEKKSDEAIRRIDALESQKEGTP